MAHSLKKIKRFSAIVLAAGKGVRMKSVQAKVLTSLCGKTLLDTVVDNLLKVKSLSEIVIVLNKTLLGLSKDLKSKSKRINIAIQARSLGTADAVKAGIGKISKKNTDVFVIGADIVLLKLNTIGKLIKFHTQNNNAVSLLSAFFDSPEGYGRIVRNKSGSVERITEEIDLSLDEKEIREINSGVYCFKRECLESALKHIKLRKNKNEYYLTDAIELLASEGIGALAAESADEILGINSFCDLVNVRKIMSKRIINTLLDNGVKILDPATTYIEVDAVIGPDTIIYPFTYIETGTKIGKNCSIGPFARLRKGVQLADNVTVGNFIELSRSRIGKGTLIKHFGYIGDARIGEKVNVGAGSVTANFDGVNKNLTKIEQGAFIGCDTVLIAPVKIGKNAVTGAGSVVTKRHNVPAGSLALGVPARLVNKKKNKS
ncbi:MAG: sugar phosphate nucleotidyltransferase [Candidatus Omnitrophota bacterium]